MPENHDHSRFIYNSYYYDGHRLDPSDLDLAAYIDARIALNPGGAVQSLTAGTGVTLGGTAANPVINATGGSSYLVYTALLTQSGTDAPVATVLQNTLGGTVVWTRVVEGYYEGTLNGVFTANKTYCTAMIGGGVGGAISFRRSDSNVVQLETGSGDGTPEDGWLNTSAAEIRVYP